MNVECLAGVKKLEPVKYVLERQPNGIGLLSSEFMTMEGDFEEMLSQIYIFGRANVTVIEHEEFKIKSKPWWKRWMSDRN